MIQWQLKTERMNAVVNSVGGMVGQWEITLNGKSYFPLALAPWGEDEERISLPPILQNLQGEWACVPFGITKPLEEFGITEESENAIELDTVIDNDVPHGKTSNHEWRLVKHEEDSILLEMDVFIAGAKCQVRREVSLDDTSLSLRFGLDIKVDKPLRIPIGLHPTFAISSEPGMTEIQSGHFAYGKTYPIQFERASELAIKSRFDDLACVPRCDGKSEDISMLPFTRNREELVQLLNTNGQMKILRHDLGITSILQWEPEAFPHCCLWMSSRGRDEYPWLSRHLALGVEPTQSFFDLNPSLAGSEHGLAMLSPEKVFQTHYSISVTPIKGKL